MKNVNTDSHRKKSTKYFETNQFNRQKYNFIAKSLLLLALHSWAGNLCIKLAEIADIQNTIIRMNLIFGKNQIISKIDVGDPESCFKPFLG